jgi:hypothetical protein
MSMIDNISTRKHLFKSYLGGNNDNYAGLSFIYLLRNNFGNNYKLFVSASLYFILPSFS